MVCMEPTAEGPRTPVLKGNVRPGPRDRLPRARGRRVVRALASAHDESAARAAEDNIIVRRLINETSGSNMVIHHDQIK